MQCVHNNGCDIHIHVIYCVICCQVKNIYVHVLCQGYNMCGYKLTIGRWADIGVCIQFKDEKYHYFCE